MKYPANESSKLEFKEELPENEQILNTTIAFCNTDGGKIIIGIKNNGIVSGIAEKKIQSTLEWLDKMIYESCTPPIIPLIYQQRIDDKTVLIIEVSSGMNKPYYKTTSGLANGTFVRLGRSTMKADADMIEELKWQSRGISYDQLPIYHAKPDQLSTNKIAAFFSSRRNGSNTKPTEEMLLAYRIITKEHGRIFPTVAGMLLFGKNPQRFFPEAYILCTHFSGNRGREAIASQNCMGTLTEQYDTAFEFVMNHLSKSFKITAKRRKEEYEIPPIAIREALMNAILHRNYHIKASVKVAIYNNRVEIFSQGTFPGPIDVSNLQTGVTYIRNTAIARILWESRYIEKMGSGFIAIFECYSNASLLDPTIIEGINYIKCILPREKMDIKPLDDAKRVLNLLKTTHEISRADITTRLKIPRSTAGRILSRLFDEGKLSRTGKGRGVKYYLRDSETNSEQ